MVEKQTLVTVSCPVCINESCRTLYAYPESGLKIVKCVNCELVYTSPRLSQSTLQTTVYGKDYFCGSSRQKFRSNFIENENILRQKWSKDLLPLIDKRLGGTGRLLDVGCGIGIFVDQAQKMGWQAWGVEVSDWAADYAREKYDIEVTTGGIENCAFPDGFFDAVTMLNVLEHLPQPLAVLGKVFRLLRPGGYLLAEVPDIESPESKRAGKDWNLLSPEEHLVHYSPKTLHNLFNWAGFNVDIVKGVGGSGVLDRLDRHGLKWPRLFIVQNIKTFEWLRRLSKLFKHAIYGTSKIMIIAQKV